MVCIHHVSLGLHFLLVHKLHVQQCIELFYALAPQRFHPFLPLVLPGRWKLSASNGHMPESAFCACF